MVRRIADIKKTKRNRKTNDNTENNLKKRHSADNWWANVHFICIFFSSSTCKLEETIMYQLNSNKERNSWKIYSLWRFKFTPYA